MLKRSVIKGACGIANEANLRVVVLNAQVVSFALLVNSTRISAMWRVYLLVVRAIGCVVLKLDLGVLFANCIRQEIKQSIFKSFSGQNEN